MAAYKSSARDPVAAPSFRTAASRTSGEATWAWIIERAPALPEPEPHPEWPGRSCRRAAFFFCLAHELSCVSITPAEKAGLKTKKPR
jgi:hypothetical protein